MKFIIPQKIETPPPQPDNQFESTSEVITASSKKIQTPPPITIQPIEIQNAESNQTTTDEEQQHQATSPQLEPEKTLSKGVTVQDCILWSEADTTGNILAEIPKGTPIDIFETISFFYKVKYQGKKGFVYIYFVETDDDN